MSPSASIQTTTGQTMNLPKRAARGAALLDEKVPDWYKDVNIDTLDQAHYLKCVLGQVFGRYADGSVEIGNLSHKKMVKHGFTAEPGTPWAELTDSWRAEIYARRSVATGREVMQEAQSKITITLDVKHEGQFSDILALISTSLDYMAENVFIENHYVEA